MESIRVEVAVIEKVLGGTNAKDASSSRCVRLSHIAVFAQPWTRWQCTSHPGVSDVTDDTLPGELLSCSQQSSGGVYGLSWRQAPITTREHSISLTFCQFVLEQSSQ